MPLYPWAANISKLHRATKEGATEAEIKAEYIRLGGLVFEDSTSPVTASDSFDTVEVEITGTEPKKRGRKPKHVE